MNSDQKTVAIGAASGIISMIVLVWYLYQILPTPNIPDDFLYRFAFALQMNVFAVLPLFVAIAAVGNGRFLSDAINPLRHAESQSMEINGRVADNTLQQNFVFLIGTLALSFFLTPASIKLLMALAIVFVLARVVFWIGYRIHPLYRAPGMAATSYMNLGILVFSIYLFLTNIHF